MKFPFLWGAATSSHQVEGDNFHNDWWAWEKAGRVKTPSGRACDHYHRYNEDFDLAASLGHNAHRLSLEWSRFEPRENEWNETAFEHYRKVLEALKTRNIQPIVTLHHFTNPQWFAEKGGWETPQSVDYFLRFVKRVVAAYGEFTQFWITINEPTIYVYHGYSSGLWPPGKTSFKAALKVVRNLAIAHAKSYAEIHRIYRSEFKKDVWVSFANHVIDFEPCRAHSLADRVAVYFRNWFVNHLLFDAAVSGFLFFPGVFCEFLPVRNALDFIGINYYSRNFIRFVGVAGEGSVGGVCGAAHHQEQTGEKNALGWDIYPRGLYHVLKKMEKYDLPVVVCENGICAHEDSQRERFIRDHLAEFLKARSEGVKAQGYLYWSLMDNFEWADGYSPRFGIVEVDYSTQERKIRKSAHVLTEICRRMNCHE